MTSDLFDSRSVKLHRTRAKKRFAEHDFLYTHVEQELRERLQDLGKSFESACVIASGEELSLAPPRDLIVSCLKAHWVNNLPCFLSNIRQSLKPEGLFLGAFWGGQTLHELRESLLQAELALKGGASPRVAPMVQPKDAPLLLSRAEFSRPVVDVETLVVTYPSLQGLMKDLRGMGESNSMKDRLKTFTSRPLFKKAEEIYQELFGLPEGRLSATFEVIYLTGWGA